MIYTVVNAVPPLVLNTDGGSLAGDAFLSQPVLLCKPGLGLSS